MSRYRSRIIPEGRLVYQDVSIKRIPRCRMTVPLRDKLGKYRVPRNLLVALVWLSHG